MKDTITKIITKEVDFKEDLKLNPLTTITVERKDSILTAILDLRNSQVLFVEEKKEYRNKYKNVTSGALTTLTAAAFCAAEARSYSSTPRFVFAFCSIVIVLSISMIENPA